jgi:transmembrane sensor
MNDQAQPSAAQLRQAADWFARLDETADEAAWLDFTAWLEADSAHRSAYDQVEAMWIDLDQVESPGTTVVAFRPRNNRRIIVWGAAAAAAAAAAIFVGPQLSAPKEQVYEAAVGQPKTVTLADGSKIALNSGAKVSVTYRRGARFASLDRGEADFDIFHNEQRPFTVAVGDNAIRVLGTQFDVVRRNDGLTVTVERGLIAVMPMVGGGNAVQVAAGRQLRRTGQADLVREVAATDAAAWRIGKLVYRDAPLAEVAEDISRYGSVPITVEPGVANLKVTAVLKLDAEEAMVDRLQSFLPIQTETTASEIRLRGAPNQQ